MPRLIETTVTFGADDALKQRRLTVDPIGVSALSVVPWKKYGHHRLYVNTSAGDRVGWVDLQTGKVTLEQGHLRHQFEAALEDHGVDPALVGNAVIASPSLPSTIPGGPPSFVDSPWPPPPISVPDLHANVAVAHDVIPNTEVQLAESPWVDLALNQPGQGVKEQAIELRQAAPIRTLMARIANVHTEERAYRVGAAGEVKVGRQLAHLPATWRVLHSVPIGVRGSDIDHVVIGPGGVFTINTKHHPDANVWVRENTFKVNGNNQPYVRNARFEAERAAAKLTELSGFPVAVTGVIAVVGARGGFTVKAQPPGHSVFVLGRRDMVDWLLAHGVVWSPDQVNVLFAGARRSTTWS